MALGLVDWKDVSKHTNWGVILLFAAAISLGVQMKNTGAATWIGNFLISQFSSLSAQFTIIPYILNIFLTTLFSNIMSSSATVAVLGPITLNMGGDSLYMGMTTAISSAFGYFSAVAAPACMIIYSSGMIKITDFIKAGWRVGIMSVVTLLIIYKFYWPLVIGLTNFK
jgi:sodium-dependent dicarboxylate transporter 2/3/5